MLQWQNCETHYYSIDEILATQEKVPCTFLKDVPKMDCLGYQSDNGGIQKNAVVEIPFWMAEELVEEDYYVIRVEVPKIYKDVYIDILNADASVVDLFKMSKFFYAFGKQISTISNEHPSHLCSLLIQTFKERFRQLLDWVQNMSADEVITEKLDFSERQLLINGRTSQKKLECWLSNGIRSVQPAEVVVNHKKRKLGTIEGF